MPILLIPDISATAFRMRQSKIIEFWYILRALNLSGSGILDKDIILAALVNLYRYAESVPPIVIYNWVRASSGIPYRSMDGTVWPIYGVARVVTVLGVEVIHYYRIL